MSVFLSMCQLGCLNVKLNVRVLVCLSGCLSEFKLGFLSITFSVWVSVCLSEVQFLCQGVSLFV